MNIGDRYVNALTKKYEAQIAEAEANLALYFSGGNLAAIGEHSDLMEEQDKWISNLAEAKDKLETLKSLNLRDSSIERINS